jgi:regulation of enolase protein 1 (concanavalin A-like superfamily)
MNANAFEAGSFDIAWSEGSWRNQPLTVLQTPSGSLTAEAEKGSDAWQMTWYGFARDSEHGLLRPFTTPIAIEVDFIASMTEQFDQAGLLLRVDSKHWVKAGAEFADGFLRVGAVVTDTYSDWSSAPVPHWSGKKITVRASLADGAVTVRARAEDEPFELVRLAPFTTHGEEPVHAGPYLCAPSRTGFRAEFTGWRAGPAERSLH